MWNRFLGIIKAYKLLRPQAKALQATIVACNDYRQADDVLDTMQPERNTYGDCQEYRAFYEICKACVSYEIDLKIALQAAVGSTIHSVDGFRTCGANFNEGLACWILGILYEKQGKTNPAVAEYNRGIQIFKQMSKLFEAENNLAGKNECEQNIRQITSRTVWPIVRLVFQGQNAADEIILDGKSHKFYSALNNHMGTTMPVGIEKPPTPTVGWGWNCVKTEDMKMATPTPIDRGDYILVENNRAFSNGDIVLAEFRNPVAPGEEIEGFKRYTEKELLSETDDEIKPIPVTKDVRILGVAIVIAKPVE